MRRFFLISLILAGCATIVKLPRYTEISREIYYFEPESATSATQDDSLEISIRYMLQDSLDSYFLFLSKTGAGETIYEIEPQTNKSRDKNEPSWQSMPARVKAMNKLLSQKHIIRESGSDLLNAFLFKLDVATLSNDDKKYSFMSAPYYGTIGEIEKNPFNIQEYQSEIRTGSATQAFYRTNLGVGASTAYMESSRKIKTGQMGLDVFEIAMRNNSSKSRYLSTGEFWLVDDKGNQQQLLDLSFFESLYLKVADKDKRPLRFANIQRTILTDGPVFPGQLRKAFMAFYPISTAAKSFKIYWESKDDQNSVLTWSFYPKFDAAQSKCLNVGVRVKSKAYSGWLGIKNALVFIEAQNIIGVSSDGGILSGLADIEGIGNVMTIHAIAAGNPNPGEQSLRVLYGSKTIKLSPNKPGPEYVEVFIEPYIVTF